MLERIGRGLIAVEGQAARLARQKRSVIVLVGCMSLAGRALLLPILPIPKPAIQDEFSYLLASDTFASGRLANPTPALAEHFETPQVLVRPTYASKYPPFSAMLMALGQKLTGDAWVGVWLSLGLLCSAICWALQGWLPCTWALLGSIIALLRIGLVSYWSESYWGGACAALGGALIIGAVPRLVRREPSLPVIVTFAAGLAILANTRPYEGFVLAIACLGFLTFVTARRHAFRSHLLRKILLPTAVLLVPVVLWMGYYNFRVTGHVLELPYYAHEKQYVVWSPLLWNAHPAPEPSYTSSSLRDFWLKADVGEKIFARDHLLKAHVSDFLGAARFFLGWPLVLCIVVSALALWRDTAARSALLLGSLFYAGAAFDARLFPHYAAPATALAYIVAASGMRMARRAWPGSGTERVYLTWALMLVFMFSTGLGLLKSDNLYLFGPIDYHVRAKRAHVLERLDKQTGDQLVLVRYGIQHDLYEELVYNQANIDRSRVIWARSLDPRQDVALIGRYPSRTVWLLEENGTTKLTRYTPEQEKGTNTTRLLPTGTGRF